MQHTASFCNFAAGSSTEVEFDFPNIDFTHIEVFSERSVFIFMFFFPRARWREKEEGEEKQLETLISLRTAILGY